MCQEAKAMGLSEWGMLLRNAADLPRLKALIQGHNNLSIDDSMRGEDLTLGNAFVTFGGGLYACLHSSGGRDRTSRYVALHWTGPVLWPLHKPQGWDQCRDYMCEEHAQRVLARTDA